MPHGHLSYPQTLPQGLVNSQELEIPWVSLSGTAFAFQWGKSRYSEEESRWTITMWNVRYRLVQSHTQREYGWKGEVVARSSKSP